MKKLLVIAVLIVTMNMMSSEINDSIYSDSPMLNRLIETTSAAFNKKLEGKPIILFMAGHNAQIWSAVVKDGAEFSILSGKINSQRGNVVAESKDSNLIDSIALINKYRPLLLWAIDSLPLKAKIMKSIKSKEYNPFSPSLMVMPLKNGLDFHSGNTYRFAGPDSIEFNGKFDSLFVLMYWLAEPFLRPYTPDSIFIR